MKNQNYVSQFQEYTYGEDDSGEWIEGAISLDSRLIKADPELSAVAEDLFPKVLKSIEDDNWIKNTDTTKSKPRLKYAFKTVLFNLYLAYLMNAPVRYSRSKENYRRDRRYGQLYFKYLRIIPVIETLRNLQLIRMKHGFRNKDNNCRKQSRMWAAEGLVEIFRNISRDRPLQVFQCDLDELVVLKDLKKKAAGYTDTANTNSMRQNLLRYNEFITTQQVKVISNGNREVSLHSLCHKLWIDCLKGKATLTDLQLNGSNDNATSDTSSNTIHNTYNNINTNISITRSFFQLIHSKLTNSTKLNEQSEKLSLKYFDINQLGFVLNNKRLYRVFNRNSFNLGGRFYGALYQTMPKEFRKDIHIGGEPTVELDYAAHHIRLLYNQLGVDYRVDPYLALTDDPEERKVFKMLLLIALNAETERKAIQGFRDACLTSGKLARLPLNNANIRELLQRVKDRHAPIAGYINSGAGCWLQNLDSQITERILMRMTDMGVPCLPVHDSYIVPKQFEERLRDAMTGEYKAVIGFEPVIG